MKCKHCNMYHCNMHVISNSIRILPSHSLLQIKLVTFIYCEPLHCDTKQTEGGVSSD